jgi:hypothetical protein
MHTIKMKLLVANNRVLDRHLRLFKFKVRHVSTDHDGDEDHTQFFRRRRGSSIYWIECPAYYTLDVSYVPVEGKGEVCLLTPRRWCSSVSSQSKVVIQPHHMFVGFAGMFLRASPDQANLYRKLKDQLEEQVGIETYLLMRAEGDSTYTCMVETSQRCSVMVCEVENGRAVLTITEGCDVEHDFSVPAGTEEFEIK